VEGSKIHIFDEQTGRELFALTGHNAAIRAISFSPDGTRLLSAGGSTIIDSSGSIDIIVWDMSNGWEVGRLRSFGYSTMSLVTSADGKYFAISIDESKTAIWGEK
jgi:hypothetical protein